MARFCTKCGAPQAEGLKFCVNCGAVIAESSAPAPQAQAAQTPIAQSPKASPMAAPAGSAAPQPAVTPGSPAMKLVVVVVAVLVMLGLLTAGLCAYVFYRAKQRVTQFEQQAQAAYRVQASRAQPAPAEQPPVAPSAPIVDSSILIYPGATPTEGGAEVPMSVGGFKMQEYSTADSVDQVVAYYKDKLGTRATVTQSGGSAQVQVLGPDGVINIAIAPDGSSAKTKISIGSITK